jgi:hypothetical protein
MSQPRSEIVDEVVEREFKDRLITAVAPQRNLVVFSDAKAELVWTSFAGAAAGKSFDTLVHLESSSHVLILL